MLEARCADWDVIVSSLRSLELLLMVVVVLAMLLIVQIVRQSNRRIRDYELYSEFLRNLAFYKLASEPSRAAHVAVPQDTLLGFLCSLDLPLFEFTAFIRGDHTSEIIVISQAPTMNGTRASNMKAISFSAFILGARPKPGT
jgi:hypothetical protein